MTDPHGQKCSTSLITGAPQIKIIMRYYHTLSTMAKTLKDEQRRPVVRMQTMESLTDSWVGV